MTIWGRSLHLVLGAIATLALTFGAVATANAADIYDRSARSYDTSPYDDPRYADLYGREHHSRRDYARRYHDERSYRDWRDDHYRDRYDDERHLRDPAGLWRRHRYDRSGRYACVERFHVVMRLVRRGWRDFNPVGRDAGYVRVQARHWRHGKAVLKIDRCSGRVVAIRPLRYGRYARPVQYDRAYK